MDQSNPNQPESPAPLAPNGTPTPSVPQTPPVPSQPAPTPEAPAATPAMTSLLPQSAVASSDPLTDDVEKELVSHIIENLEKSKLTVEQAQSLAQEFLSLLPFQDKHDLVQKLNVLSAKYDEAKAVYVKFAAPVEEEARQKKIAEMAAHIKSGDLDQALAVAKGGENGTGSTDSGTSTSTS